jgi:hypothetical protein
MTTTTSFSTTEIKRKLIIVQVDQSPEPSQLDPLIAYGAEHLVDFGVVLLAVTIVIVIGIISKQLEYALLFALALSAFLIVILWNF